VYAHFDEESRLFPGGRKTRRHGGKKAFTEKKRIRKAGDDSKRGKLEPLAERSEGRSDRATGFVVVARLGVERHRSRIPDTARMTRPPRRS